MPNTFNDIPSIGTSYTSNAEEQSSIFNDIGSIGPSHAVPVEAEESPFYAGERSFFGDLGSRITRSATHVATLAGGALETVGVDNSIRDYMEELSKTSDILKPDVTEYLGGEGFVSRGVKGGVESLLPSLSAAVPGGIAGAKAGGAIGSVFGPAGAAAGAAGGAIVGGVLSTLALFGLGSYATSKDEYLGLHPGDEAGAHKYGLEQGVIEGGIEAAATGVEFMTLGLGKVVTRPVTSTLKQMLKIGPQELGKAYLKTAPVEASTEALQAYLGTESSKRAGLTDMSGDEAIVESIIPALTMSLFFVGGAHTYNAVQQKNLVNALNNTERPDLQQQAADLIHTNILADKQAPADAKEVAEAWKVLSSAKIANGEAFSFDADFVKEGMELQKLSTQVINPQDKILKDAGLDDTSLQNLDTTILGTDVTQTRDVDTPSLGATIDGIRETKRKGVDLVNTNAAMDTELAKYEAIPPAAVTIPEGPQGIIPSTAAQAAEVLQTAAPTEAMVAAEARVQRQQDLEVAFEGVAPEIIEESWSTFYPDTSPGILKRISAEVKDATTLEDVTAIVSDFAPRGTSEKIISTVANGLIDVAKPSPVAVEAAAAPAPISEVAPVAKAPKRIYAKAPAEVTEVPLEAAAPTVTTKLVGGQRVTVVPEGVAGDAKGIAKRDKKEATTVSIDAGEYVRLDTTMSPEDLLNQEAQDSGVSLTELEEHVDAVAFTTKSNPLAEALVRGDQETATKILGDFGRTKKMKMLREAKEIAGAEVGRYRGNYDLSEFLNSNFDTAVDTNIAKEQSTVVTWDTVAPTMLTSKVGKLEYMVVELNENEKGKEWETLQRKAGEKWESLGISTTSKEARVVVDEVYMASVASRTGADLVAELSKSKNKVVASLAKAISRLSADKLGLIGVATDAGSNYYHDKLNNIFLTKGASDVVKLHELIHAVAAREFTAASKSVRNTLDTLRTTLEEHVIAQGIITQEELDGFKEDHRGYKGENADLLYALSSTQEFLAVGLSDSKVRSLLESIPANKTARLKNLWAEFVNTVGKLLGLSPTQFTQLDKLLLEFADLASQAHIEVKGKVTIHPFGAGLGAATSDIRALDRAVQMEAQGATKEEMVAVTGWYKRDDGEWRFQVATDDFTIDNKALAADMKAKGLDKILKDANALKKTLRELAKSDKDIAKYNTLKAQMQELGKKGLFKFRMGDYYSPNSKLSQAYWSTLANTEVVFYYKATVGWEGAASLAKDEALGPHKIELNLSAMPLQKLDNVLIHEFQHIVQGIEGFALGTSPEFVQKEAGAILEKVILDAIKSESVKKLAIDLRNDIYDTELANLEAKGITYAPDIDLTVSNKFIEEVHSNPKYSDIKDTLVAEMRKSLEDDVTAVPYALSLVDALTATDIDKEKISDLAYEIYRSFLGEVEARESADMMYQTSEEVRKFVPDDIYETADGERIPVIVMQAGDSLYTMSGQSVLGKGADGNYFSTSATNTTRKQISKREYDVAKETQRAAAEKKLYDAGMEGKTIKKSLRDKGSLLGKAMTKTTQDLFKGVYFRIKDISPKSAELVRRAEHEELITDNRWRTMSRPFSEGIRKMNGGDQALLKYALINKFPDLRDKVLKRNNLTEAWSEVEKVLTEIEDGAIQTALIHTRTPNYFPNRVTDVDTFMEVFYDNKDTKEFGPFDFIVKQKEKEIGRELDEVEKTRLMHESIMSGTYGHIPLPGSAKHRSVTFVPQEGLAAYADPLLALHQHISDMSEAVAFRKILGSTNQKTVMVELRRMEKPIEVVEKKLKSDPTNATLLAEKKKLIDAFIAKRDELKSAEDDLMVSVSNVVVNIKDGKKREEVKELIRARVQQKGVHGVLANLRDISYISVLANPMSALTQLADNALTLLQAGPKHTFTALKETVPLFRKSGKGMIAVDELGLARSLAEFSNSSTSKILDSALHWSGLKGMDLFGKEVSMRATLSQWREVAKSGDWKIFSEKWSDILGDDTAKTYEHLQQDKQSAEVLFMLFNSLADRQPISLSAMSKAYLLGGQARILFMLKSFSLTFLNFALNEAKTDWKKGNHKTAVLRVTSLFAIMSMAGAGTDELKSWLTGAEEPFLDNTMDNLIQLLMINKYAINKGYQSDTLVSAAVGGYLPPLRFMDDVVADIWSVTFGEKDFKFKSLRNVPLFGKVAYAHTEPGQGGQLWVSKDRIFSKVKGGTPASKMRAEISRHNKKAREVGATDMIITYDNLRKAVRREKDKGRK